MGRYRSDESDDDRDSSRKHKKKSKKRRGRSRSGSDSESSHISSSRGKKSKKRHGRSSRSPSPNKGQGRSSRRSRSPSYDRYYSSSRRGRRSPSRSRSKSPPPSRRGRYSRSPYHSRSRSPSARKSRRSRSSSRSRGQRRRSYSRERRSGSGGRSHSHSRRSSPDSRGDATSDMKSRMSIAEQPSLSAMTPAQQAEERMRLALKAAAAADQKLRQLPSSDPDGLERTSAAAAADGGQPRFASYEESQKFADSVAAIDSGNFKQATFKSSHVRKPQEASTFDLAPSHDDAIFGSLAVTGFKIKPDPDTKPLELDPELIMHPSLFCDPEERLDRWIERLTQLRKRKLEGDAL